MKICKNCEFYRKRWFRDHFPVCTYFAKDEIDIVTGKINKDKNIKYCDIMRSKEFNYCGPEGKFFSSRSKSWA